MTTGKQSHHVMGVEMYGYTNESLSNERTQCGEGLVSLHIF